MSKKTEDSRSETKRAYRLSDNSPLMDFLRLAARRIMDNATSGKPAKLPGEKATPPKPGEP